MQTLLNRYRSLCMFVMTTLLVGTMASCVSTPAVPGTAAGETQQAPDSPSMAATGDQPTETASTPTPASPLAAAPLPRGARLRLGKGIPSDCALSPDGTLVAIGSTAGIQLYRLEPFEQVWSQTTAYRISSIEFSNDGALLYSGTYEGFAGIWDVPTGQLLTTLDLDHEPMLAWSPDKSQVAAADGRSIVVWSVATGQKLTEISADDGEIWTAAWSPDGTRLAAGTDKQTIQLWDMQSGKIITMVTDDFTSLALVWSPDGSRFASGSGKVWDVNGEPITTPSPLASTEFSGAAWSPDGNRLALQSTDTIGDDTRPLIAWDVATGKPSQTFAGLNNPTNVAWSSDGAVLAGLDAMVGEVIIWDAATGEKRLILYDHVSSVVSARFSPDGTKIAAISTSGMAMFDTQTGTELYSAQGLPDGNGAAWSPDSKQIATARDGLVVVLDAETGAALWMVDAPGTAFHGVFSVAWSPDGRLVLGASYGAVDIYAWDAKSRKMLYALRNLAGGNFAMSPDGKQFAFQPDTHIAIADAMTGKQIVSMEGDNTWSGLAWSPDGSYLSVSNNAVWDAHTGKMVLPLTSSVEWSPDGRRLATQDGFVRDVRTGEKVMTVESCVSNWSPDGRLFTCGPSLYDATTGAHLMDLPVAQDQFVFSEWSPDGKTLATGMVDGTIILWDAATLLQ